MAEGFEIGRAFIEVFTEDRTEEGTSSMGKSLLAWAGGIGIGAIIGEQILGGLDIEAGVDKMQAQLGIGADKAAELGKLAGDLYANNYGESMDSVRDTITAVVSTVPGMSEASDQAIQDIAKTAENFQSAFGVPVEESVNSISLLMTQGLAGSAEDAADLMTAAMQKLPVALRGDFGDVIDEYGQSFAAMGFTGSQTMEMLVDASQQGGIGMDKYGDAIKEFGINVGSMSSSAAPAFEALGLDQKAMADQFLAGGDSAKDATTTIRNALQSMTDPAAQAQAALALFGTPLEDLGTDQIPAFLDGLGGVEGGLAGVKDASGTLDDTLNGNAKATFDTFKRQAMMELSSIINEKVIPAIQTVIDWFIRFQTPITIIAGIITGLLVPAFVVAAAQATISAVKQVAAWVLAQAGAVAGAATAVVSAGLVVAGWVLMGIQSLLGAAKVAAAWLIAMGPIGLVIAAVVGLVAIIILNWDTIKNAITTAVQFVLDWLSANWPLILAIITGPIGLIVLAIVKNWDTIVAGVVWLKDEIVGAWNTVIGFLSGIPGTIMGWLSGMWNFIVDQISGVYDQIQVWINYIVDFVTGIPGRVVAGLGRMADAIVQPFIDAYNRVVGWVDKIVNKAKSIATLGMGETSAADLLGLDPNTGLPAGRAGGGFVVAGQTYTVGESGIEQFTAPSNGHIESNYSLRQVANRVQPTTRAQPIVVQVVAELDGKVVYRNQQKWQHREAARA